MADSGAKFNRTDVIDGKLPNVRLVFYGTSGEYRFIYFESGGRAAHSQFILEKNRRLVLNRWVYYHPYKGLGRLKAILSR